MGLGTLYEVRGDALVLVGRVYEEVMEKGGHASVVDAAYQTDETMAMPCRKHIRGLLQGAIELGWISARHPAHREEQLFYLPLRKVACLGIFYQAVHKSISHYGDRVRRRHRGDR